MRREHEPWTILRRTSYKLLPYFYNLFIEHERSGAAICRPLLFDFDEPQFERTDDQFMVGPARERAALRDTTKRRRSPARSSATSSTMGKPTATRAGSLSRIEGVVYLRGKHARVEITRHDAGYGPCRVRFVFYAPVESVEICLDGAARRRSVKPCHWDMMGTPLRVHRSVALTI